MTYKYKTKGDIELEIPNVGVTVNGYITSNTPLESPNLVLVTDEVQQPTPAPTHLDGVVQQNQQPVPVAAPTPAPVQESENV